LRKPVGGWARRVGVHARVAAEYWSVPHCLDVPMCERKVCGRGRIKSGRWLLQFGRVEDGGGTGGHIRRPRGRVVLTTSGASRGGVGEPFILRAVGGSVGYGGVGGG